MKNILIVAFLLLLFLNIFDGVSTYILLNAGALESNVSMEWMMNKLGIIPGMIVYKGTFIVMLAYFIYLDIITNKLSKREHSLILSGTILLAGVYLYFMVTHNLQYLLELS